ncbi:MAG TPA: hypothetical protein VHY20_14265, partial [Pirellulales bacterium]|nr:hypothetical protein [Pirellulales bacterium]
MTTLSQRLEQVRPASTADATGLQSLREALRADARALAEQVSAFDERLEHEAQILVDDPSGAGNTRRIEELLATTLPTAAWRRRLIECLPRSESQPPAFKDRALAVRPSANPLDQPRWQRLVHQAELELRLVRWADAEAPQLAGAGEKLAQAISDRPLEPQPAGDERAWRALGEFGHALAAYYRELPQRINERAHASNEIASQRAVERLLRMVDGRDAERIDERVSIAPLPTESAEATLALDTPARLRVGHDDWTRLDVRVQSDRGLPAEVWAALDFDPARLEVRTLEPEQALLPRVRPSVPPLKLDDQGAGQFNFLVRSKLEDAAPTPLEVRVHAANREFTRTLSVELPGADRIDWLVLGSPGTVGGVADGQRWTADDEGTLDLHPFPNRTTGYRFALRNRSGREQKVQVTLLAPPPTSRFSQRPELSPMAAEWAAAGFERLATIKDLALPADDTAVPLVYSVAPPPAAAPAADAAATAKPPPKVRPVLHHRLIGVIEDASRPERKWVKWLEFSIQPPRNYLNAEAGYDRATARITVRLRPVDFDQDGQPDLERMPPGGSLVKWEPDGGIDPAAAMRAEDEAAAPDFNAQLFADVPPDNQKNVNVRLTVDGYPRAFVWLVNCGNTQARLRPRRDLRRVKITSPLQNDAFRAPLAALSVQLEVDAPADAFRDPAARDVFEVGLDATLDRALDSSRARRFYADRQVELYVDDLKADGTVMIDAQVHDYRLDLEPLGLMNTVVEIGAQLTIGRQE